MKRLLALVLAACVVDAGACTASTRTQATSKTIDWKAELRKAKVGIKKNPESAFWHSQAGVAYDALGNFQEAERQLRLAAKLDPTNPIGFYSLYALYQRRGNLSQQRKVLLSALEIDPANPVGHFQLATVLEKEGFLDESLKEYRKAKSLASNVNGIEYIDPRGNPFEVEVIKTEVQGRINSLANHKKSD